MTQQRTSTNLQPTASETYRYFLARGFTQAEAANLAAYLGGLPLGDQPWTISEVSQILFLRELDRSAAFGPNDGGHHRWEA
jgi:hypothetical protein